VRDPSGTDGRRWKTPFPDEARPCGNSPRRTSEPQAKRVGCTDDGGRYLDGMAQFSRNGKSTSQRVLRNSRLKSLSEGARKSSAQGRYLAQELEAHNLSRVLVTSPRDQGNPDNNPDVGKETKVLVL